jgi:hypothetical protein
VRPTGVVKIPDSEAACRMPDARIDLSIARNFVAPANREGTPILGR